MPLKRWKTENSQKRENFMVANTITARGSMIRLSQGGRQLIRWRKKHEGSLHMITLKITQYDLLTRMGWKQKMITSC
jgi:hypothetical protein